MERLPPNMHLSQLSKKRSRKIPCPIVILLHQDILLNLLCLRLNISQRWLVYCYMKLSDKMKFEGILKILKKFNVCYVGTTLKSCDHNSLSEIWHWTLSVHPTLSGSTPDFYHGYGFINENCLCLVAKHSGFPRTGLYQTFMPQLGLLDGMSSLTFSLVTKQRNHLR